ncbi:MAG: glycosyltransferase family 4 protein [Neomegalonema sp.]|nr:glycosyltransferase family 4 protein [Neomegalonema sp.]
MSPLRVGFAIPGPIATAVSGGYAYDRALIEIAPQFGVELTPLELPGGFPFPGGFAPSTGAAGGPVDPTPFAVSDAILSAWRGPLLIDGLAYGAFPEKLARKVGPRAAALVHHPLALETGLSPARTAYLRRSERAALAQARAVIATSETTAQALTTEYGVAPAQITVAPPGFDRRPRAAMAGAPPTILSVGAAIRRKRLPELIAALSRLTDLPWRFRHIGPLDVDPLEKAALDAAVSGIGGPSAQARLRFDGAVDDPAFWAAYREADLFVSAAAYEGYGMAIAEAVLHGLPIVATDGGAARSTAAAGRLIDSELEQDALSNALAAAMRPLLSRAEKRREAGEHSWAARNAILTPEATMERVARALNAAFGEG